VLANAYDLVAVVVVAVGRMIDGVDCIEMGGNALH
jgi:hypothetical protein